MSNSLKKSVKKNLYSFIRFAPISFMDNVRSYIYKSIGVKSGKYVRIRIGAIIDCWESGKGGIGKNVFID